MTHIDGIVKALDVSKPREKTDIERILRRVTESISSRGLVVLISDFLVDREPLIRGLEMLCHRRHDLLIFHVLDDGDRKRYVDSLAAVVRPGGRYHMLCFSDLQPGDWGPRRVTQDEIRAAFSEWWVVDSIEATVIDLTWDPAGAHAWLVEATRK